MITMHAASPVSPLSTINTTTTMNTTTKSTNPARALRFLAPVLGLAIALSTITTATATPAAPAWVKQSCSYGEFYFAPSVGADHYEVYIDGGFTYNSLHTYNVLVPALGYPGCLFDGFPTVSLSWNNYWLAPTPDNFHKIQVLAVDAAGNKSDLSPPCYFEILPNPNDQISISSSTVKAGEHFTLQCGDCYFDQIDLFKCPDDGRDDAEFTYEYLRDNGILVAFVGPSGFLSETHWDNHKLAPFEQVKVPYGWWYEETTYNGLEYHTEGSRLIVDLVENSTGTYRYVAAFYGTGIPQSRCDDCGSIISTRITVTP